MPAPHDQRFSLIFKAAQDQNRFTDRQLLTLFELALERAIKNEPNLAEDKVITKAMRSWFRRIVPGEDMPEFLAEDVQLKRQPRFGDAVVIPLNAKGTFWWNRQTKKVQWAWWDPSRPGHVVHSEPQSDTQQETQEGRARTSQLSPRITVKTEPRGNEGRVRDAVFSGFGVAEPERRRLGSTLPERAQRNNYVRKRQGNLPDSRGSPTSEQARQFTTKTSNCRSSSYLPATPSQRGFRSDTHSEYFDYNEDGDNMADMTPSPAREALIDEENDDKEEERQEEADIREANAVTRPSRSATPADNADPADDSIVLVEKLNEYYPIEAFITQKALKDGWSREELDEGWNRCKDLCWAEHGHKGRAYVQYRTEMKYWCCMYPDEVFPGRDPSTTDFLMFTQREMLDREISEEEHAAGSLSRTPSPSSQPPRKRARTSTQMNGNH